MRTAKQDRSIATRERLLDAAAVLFEERGYDELTLAEVAARADVAVGSIYQRIGNKGDLLVAVYDRRLAAIRAEVDELLAPERFGAAEPAAAVAAAVEAIAALFARHGALLRVVIGQSTVQPALLRRASEHVRALGERFSRALLQHRAAFAHPDPATGVDVCFRIAFSTLARRTTHGPRFESTHELSDEALVENVAWACAGLLLRLPAADE